MKAGMIIASMIFVSMSALSASGKDDVISRVNSLVEKEKYNAAFILLEKADPKNKKPDLLVMKTNILLQYFVDSMMHRTFALRDLGPGESLAEIRGKPGLYDIHIFPADEILERALEKNPGHGGLYRVLGDYYFSVYHLYGDRWYVDPLVVLNRALNNYRKAVQFSSMPIQSLYNLGLIYLVRKEYVKAESVFRDILEKDSAFGPGYYHIAYIHYLKDEFDLADEYSRKALKHGASGTDRGNASYLLGLISEKKDLDDRAHRFYLQALRHDGNSYRNLKTVVISALKTGRINEGVTCAEKIIKGNPENIGILKDMVYIFGSLRYSEKFMVLLDGIEGAYGDNDLVLGNLYFCRALVHSEYLKNRREKKANLLRALEYYKKVYSDDHEVFNIIRMELEK